jgi:D-alanyl-lipoteichoic acid acyltransferase DltB (MBOAT superfamily)
VAQAYAVPDANWGTVVVGTVLFAVQIYCDFSGYSDIARGFQSCFGIELTVNFRQPYFARSPREFWQRWHISLSRWLGDYLYKPLGGSRGSLAFTCRNLMLTMLLGGLWHGAAWNFVLWGLYHGTILSFTGS